MKCPKCRSRGFKPSSDIRRPLVNIGGKESYETVSIRRYVCVCCGHAFKTQETFLEEIVTVAQGSFFAGASAAPAG